MDVTNVVDEDKTVRRRLFLQRALFVELLVACFGYQILILQSVFFFLPHRIQPKTKTKKMMN